MVLVKQPAGAAGRRSRQVADIFYKDIGDLLSREEKLDLLRNSRLDSTDWRVIVPNDYGDWIRQRNATFDSLYPLTASDATSEGCAPIFMHRTLGLLTSRDAWCYASSQHKLEENIRRSVTFYNEQLAAFQETRPSGSTEERTARAKRFARHDSKEFHWNRENYRDLANGKRYAVNRNGFRVSAYRPFFKQHLYFDQSLNNSIRDFPEIYPTPQVDNLGIYITGPGSSVPFSLLMTNTITDSGLTSGNGSSPYIPRFYYTTTPTNDILHNSGEHNSHLVRISNINPQALTEFCTRYGDSQITEDDLFHYVYGVLHSARYREMFANDLAKSQVRIPMVASRADFSAFVQAGMDLAGLHVGYEHVEPYSLEEVCSPSWNPRSQNAFLVTKMCYAGSGRNRDKTRIIYNADITLAGIPDEAHRYTLGSRSALDWLVECYRVKTHNESDIESDPNAWGADAGDPRYVLDLVKRVTMVSVRTVQIVEGLPDLVF